MSKKSIGLWLMIIGNFVLGGLGYYAWSTAGSNSFLSALGIAGMGLAIIGVGAAAYN